MQHKHRDKRITYDFKNLGFVEVAFASIRNTYEMGSVILNSRKKKE